MALQKTSEKPARPCGGVDRFSEIAEDWKSRSSCNFNSPNSLLLGVLNALKNGRLGAGWSGRVPGRLVSHFLSFPKQFTVRGSQCFKEWSPWCWMVWSGSRPACLPLPFICLPVLFMCLPSWVLVVGFPAGLSPTSFHLSPTSFVSQFFSFVSQAGCLWSGSRLACLPLPFICLPLLFICLSSWVLVVGFPAGLSPTSFHLSPTSFHLSPSSFQLSPRLGACGRVPVWLVSHFLSCVSHFFSFVSQFFSFVSQAGCLWSGSRLACLPLPFICLPVLFICLPSWVLVVGFLAGCLPLPFICLPLLFQLSSSSFHLSLRLGAFVFHFLECVSHFFSFVSQAGCLWSGSRLACLALPCICLPFPFICLPLLFICLPGWVLVVGFPGGLSPTSLHLSPTFPPNSLLLGA